MKPPFLILALPRSRTAWLSKFLTYGGWYCGHEELRHCRSLQDVRSWLSQPLTGSAETSAAPYWRLIAKLAPRANVVVIRRPVEDVVESLMRIETYGFGQFDRETLTAAMRRGDAKLAQAAARLPNVLTVDYAELEWAGTCAAIFEHCLPYKFDRAWWEYLAPVNVQCEFHAIMRHAQAFAPQLAKLHELAAFEMKADLATKRQEPPDGMSFQEEPFETWRQDGVPLFEKHCFGVGEAPSAFGGKNWELMERCAKAGNLQIVTARSNGRMFGYLMTVLAPSMEEPGRKSAVNTAFFADEWAPGIGLKLQRFALQCLKDRGINEVFFRSGYDGSAKKVSALYRRLGARPDGEMHRLTIQ